jgi:aspartate racemase
LETKSLGVIGGMGPMATAVFMQRVIENTVASRDQDHINMVVLNHATLPDRTRAILEDGGDIFLQAIEKDIKLLEAAGVEHIAIPCNTSHYFFEDIQAMTDIKLINMVDETAREIYQAYGEHTRVGILATNGTISSGIYQRGCSEYHMQLHQPDKDMQERIMDIIYNQVKVEMNVDPTRMEAIIRELFEKHQCSCVIIACTELSCIQLSAGVASRCVDAMDVLVKKSIERSGKVIKSS